ncbi:MAG: hypothetical protein Q8K51_08195 [Nitrospirota bacterium]|nr:hypothetical protein [Nitrospirota bacterium]
MKYFLVKESALKWLETPSVYNIKKDELYELDNDSFKFLKKCQTGNGCRYRAELFSNPMGKDLYRCALYKETIF